MTSLDAEALRLRFDGHDVGGLWLRPSPARAAFVFAHGAGAGMHHAFMDAFAQGLALRGIATLRFEFPFMARGSRRVDAPEVAHRAVRAACAAARRVGRGLPLFAGGKSFGARMTSQAQAIEPIDGVLALIFVGFPLHPSDQPSTSRADHLVEVRCPMLFLQGGRDALAALPLVRDVVRSTKDRSTLAVFDDADHAFHVRRSSGTDDARVLEDLLDATANFVATVVAVGMHRP